MVIKLNFTEGLRSRLLLQPRISRTLEIGLVIILAIVAGRLISDLLSFSDYRSASSVTQSKIRTDLGKQSPPGLRTVASSRLMSLFGVPDLTELENATQDQTIEEGAAG